MHIIAPTDPYSNHQGTLKIKTRTIHDFRNVGSFGQYFLVFWGSALSTTTPVCWNSSQQLVRAF
jgi:hypothetical protein